MKLIKIVAILSSVLVAILYFINHRDCADCLWEDEAFLKQVKSRLSQTGDKISVNEIYPGEWETVCAVSLGGNANLIQIASEEMGVPESKIEVINQNIPFVTDNISAVFFVYPPNEIKIFRASWNQAAYFADNDKRCVENQSAIFHVVRDETQRFTTEIIERNKIPSDYIEVRLLKGEQGAAEVGPSHH